jgi:hypothetical protein
MSHRRRTPCCVIEAHRFLDNIEGDHDTLAADLALAAAVQRLPTNQSWTIDSRVKADDYVVTLWESSWAPKRRGTGSTLEAAITAALEDDR